MLFSIYYTIVALDSDTFIKKTKEIREYYVKRITRLKIKRGSVV